MKFTLPNVSWVRLGYCLTLVFVCSPFNMMMSCFVAKAGITRLRPPLPRSIEQLTHPTPESQILLAERGFQPSVRPSIEGSPVEYIVISPPAEDMLRAWQAFADQKTAEGHPAVVVSTDWIGEQYPIGLDLADRLRQFLRDGYIHWGLRWVLLGGDADQIPLRYVRSWAYNGASEKGTNLPCEYYYACLEGTWDADGDGIFGESIRYGNLGDKVDFSPEIQVGRVSAHDAEDVSAFAQKHSHYSWRPPDDGYLEAGLLLAEVLFHPEWSATGRAGEPDCYETCSPDTCRLDDLGNPICVSYDASNDAFDLSEVLEDELDLGLELELQLEAAAHWQRPGHSRSIIQLTLENLLDAVEQGTGFVYHLGQTNEGLWSIGDDLFPTFDLSALQNGARRHYFWAGSGGSFSAALDAESIGEALVIHPVDGAVAYIGNTNIGYPTTTRMFSEETFRQAYLEDGRTIGDGFFIANDILSPFSENETTRRFTLFSRVLLGDPGMVVWRRTPNPLVLEYEPHPALGADELLVSVSDPSGPVAGARVCVQKRGDVYVIGLTGAGGTVDIPFWAESEGPFSVIATCPGHKPQSGRGIVVDEPAGEALIAGPLGIVDDGSAGSLGNGNAAIELGETIRLTVEIENLGDATATDVTATLRLADEFPAGLVTMSDSQSSLGTLHPGESILDSLAFLLEIAAIPPAGLFPDSLTHLLLVPFELELASANEVHQRADLLEVSRPHLVVAPNEWTQVGTDVLDLQFGVFNTGKGTASHLQAKIEAENAGIVVVGPTEMEADDIAPDGSALIGPFTLEILDYDSGRVTVSLWNTQSEPNVLLHARSIDLLVPEALSAPALIGFERSIQVTWEEAIDPGDETVAGYRVMRTLSGEGHWVAAHPGILTNHRAFFDDGLGPLTSYDYRIRAMDPGGNLGDPSAIGTVSTVHGTLEGWPNVAVGSGLSSPLICELDGINDGVGNNRRDLEIVFGRRRLYAFHSDGSEWVDGDNRLPTVGPFSGHPQDFRARPAAADIDCDGITEVVATSSEDGMLRCWHPTGGDPVWERSIPGSAHLSAPTLVDLDHDGFSEVILGAGSPGAGGIYVFSHDGTAWTHADENGLLLDLGGSYVFGSPAVGDVDGDDNPDIAICVSLADGDGALWIITPDGTALPGFEGLLFSDLGYADQSTSASIALADVDDLPGDEVFALTRGHVWSFGVGGDLRWEEELPQATPSLLLSEPVLGDIDRAADGRLETALVDADGRLWVWHADDGSLLPSFPLHLGASASVRFGGCLLANVDQVDYNPEVVFGSSDGVIYAIKYNATSVQGFPLVHGGDLSDHSLAAWDVNGDGEQNLAVQANNSSRMTVLDLRGVPFHPKDNPWPMRHHDHRNSGRATQDAWWLELDSRGRPNESDPKPVCSLRCLGPNPLLEGNRLRINYQITAASSGGQIEGKPRLEVLDLQGRIVRALSTIASVGNGTTHWDGADNNGNRLPSGVYLLRLSHGQQMVTTRMIIVH